MDEWEPQTQTEPAGGGRTPRRTAVGAGDGEGSGNVPVTRVKRRKKRTGILPQRLTVERPPNGKRNSPQEDKANA